MSYIIDFDISALLLLAIMLFSTYYRHMVSSSAEKCFIVLLVITGATAFFDILSIMLAPMSLGVYLACMVYYALRVSIAPSYFVYLVALTDGWKIFNKLRVRVAAAGVYLLQLFLVVVVNPINGCIFDVNEYCVMTRGPLLWTCYLGAMLYFAAGTAYIFKYRNFYARNKFYCLLGIVPASLVAVVIQFFKPELLIECFTQAVCLMFYSITLQSPEERASAELHINNREAFFEDMRLSEFNKKQHSVVLFKIKNYAARVEAVSYEAGNKITSNIANRLFELIKSEELTAVPYHFGIGSFGVVFSGEDTERIDDFAQKLSMSLADDRLRRNMTSTKLEFYECIVDIPGDIDSYASIQMMLEGYQNFLPGTDAVYRVSKVPGYKEFTLYSKLDEIINMALENDRLEVFYMPIYCVEEKRFISAEALLRLYDPVYGYINPETVVSYAEENGDIHRIGRVVFEKVCEFVSTPEFTMTGLDFIEVNLSVEQFHDRHLCEKLMLIAEKYNVDPSFINFEITEGAATEVWKEVISQTKILSDAGFAFSMDDYGQKSSNLKRLSSLPIDIVKLDKSLADDYTSPSGEVILKNTVKMLKALGVAIAAEGIENRRMEARFSELGCDYLQGYTYTKALPLDTFIKYMEEVQA